MKKKERRYTGVAILRILDGTKAAYKREAKILGISYSELMRRVLMNYYEKNLNKKEI